MYEISIVLLFGFLTIFHSKIREDEYASISRKISDRLSKLWDIAHISMRENRLLRAEKALLLILKLDEKNAAAYNRLGILYAKRKEYKDAIDCFEIASSIESSPSSLHNLGLIYFETENYDKAAIAFEEAIRLEPKFGARHVAYAKVQEKLNNQKLMIASLENAVRLEPTRQTLNLLHKAYKDNGMTKEADKIAYRIKKLKKSPIRLKPLNRAKRVVV